MHDHKTLFTAFIVEKTLRTRYKLCTYFDFMSFAICVAEADEKIGIEELVDEFVAFYVAGMYAMKKCCIAVQYMCKWY